MTSRSWAVVLAGGEGRRLRSLARLIEGDDRPKQFCRVFGRQSLLQDTIARLSLNVDFDSTLCVVLRDHERYYEPELRAFARTHLVEQPCSRGTGAAVAYALRRIEALSAEPAVVGFFPSDHYCLDTKELQRTVETTYSAARRHPSRLFLVGAEATEAETDYGWIEPGPPLVDHVSGSQPACLVRRFWEKPPIEVAQALLRRGCLWNTFIVVGSGPAFAGILTRTLPALWARSEVLGQLRPAAREAVLVRSVYDSIDPADVSHDVLQRVPDELGVVPMGNAGWTDLGRPQRVLDVLKHTQQSHPGLCRVVS